MPRTAKSADKQNKNETSAQTFVRLAESRVTKAIKAIELLENLTHYEHTKEQSQKIVAALTTATEGVQDALLNPKSRKQEATFKF